MVGPDSTRSASPSKPAPKERYLKVRDTYYEYQSSQWPRPPAVPFVLLQGYWLNQVGFEVGKQIKVLPGANHLVITLAPDESEGAELEHRG